MSGAWDPMPSCCDMLRAGPHTLLHTANRCQVELLEGRAILGTSSGSVLLLDMPTGRTVMSSSSSDHMDAVTGIGTSMYLQHFVTSSQDRNVKVRSRQQEEGGESSR